MSKDSIDLVMPSGCRPVIDPGDPRRKPIPGLAVREDGVVFSFHKRWKRWHALQPHILPHGKTLHVDVYRNSKRTTLSVAAVVLGAFIGPRPLGCEPFFFPDPDPTNCAASNLRWAARGTRQALNQSGVLPPWLGSIGEANPTAELTEQDVLEIRRQACAGMEYREIAKRFAVAADTIRGIAIGRRWKHLPWETGTKPVRKRPRLSLSDARKIRALYAQGRKLRELAEQFGVNVNSIWYITSGRAYPDNGEVPHASQSV